MKKYLKKYLENKYGTPVRFPRECAEKDFLINLLRFPSRRREAELKSTNYPAHIVVMIDDEEMDRHGFELKKTSASRLDSLIKKFKDPMRIYISNEMQATGQCKIVVERFKPGASENESLNSSRYPSEITFLINEDHFRRHGWELTKTNAVRFNSFVENLFKEKMRFYILMHLKQTGQLAHVIERFRDEFKFGDDELTFDAVKKDFQRYAKRNKIEFRQWVGKKVVGEVSREFDLSKS